ncbi:hypothetical protein Tco_0730627 [Tanacetum coccineum]|uniref:Uncharacterized protein n=1 Tax=Tanacetum coccineum TaxID=301880 RepID=A0ABQ4YUU1_9ASTR
MSCRRMTPMLMQIYEERLGLIIAGFESEINLRYKDKYGCYDIVVEKVERVSSAGKSLSWYFLCICWLGCCDMSVDRGCHALYFSDMLSLYLCQTSTDTTDFGPGSSFDGPAFWSMLLA